MKKLLSFIVLFICISTAQSEAQKYKWPIKMGKYSCTASKYVNGSFEFIGRGSIELSANKTYTYKGFEKPSAGTYSIDKDGNILFKGGYINGGKAEKTDRVDRFLLVFPSNPDNRWTISHSK